MSRPAKPWYRKFTDSWYVELNEQQHNLGKHPDDAPPPRRYKKGWNAPPAIMQEFHRLMAQGPKADPLPPAQGILVCQVCDLFLDSICPFEGARPQKEKRKKGEKPKPPLPLKPNASCSVRTFWWYDAYLQDFCKYRHDGSSPYGKMPARDLVELHVDYWLDAHPCWTTSRRNAITAVKRAFNWADKKGLLRPNPIKGVERPAAVSRARTLTKDERKEILDAIDDVEFRLFVEAMQESGARPSEIARLAAADINLQIGVCVMHRHKTGKKTGKPRVIYMTPRLVEIVTPLMAKHTEGPIFRGPRLKKPFGMHGICSRFRRLREKLPHLKDAIAYAYRSSFTTDALQNGVGVAQVAELLGHKDTTMVMKHYSFIRENTEYMKEIAKKATQG
jgi:integrase